MATFVTRRSKPELVTSSRPTPHEIKHLSDLDDLRNHHEYTPVVSFFLSAGAMPEDTAKAMRVALAEALVHYYPLAGRLRELPSGKLVVDCTEEGVVFVEAEAEVRLAELGEPLVPPFPCVGELLCSDVGDPRVVLGKPLFFMQVTRFRCGGFAVGLHMIRCIADGFGWNQFIRAIADLARGETVPLILPVWERELLTARVPASIACASPVFKPLVEGSGIDDVLYSTPFDSLVHRLFHFGPGEIARLRSHVTAHLRRSCTDFEVLTAVTWRCRTAALGYEPRRNVYICFPCNARDLLHVPEGYYGNADLYCVLEVSVGRLCGGQLGRTIELVCGGKRSLLTPEYARSMVDLVASMRGRRLVFNGVYVVSDVTHLGGDGLDFGWGEWVAGGVVAPTVASFHMRCKNADGEEGVAVSMVLPGAMMERFEEELAVWLKRDEGEGSDPHAQS
ncbi:hypothetical protein SETIT_9G298600v2 [Setaria italica]|uniref:Uncharacterized protein n=2 Tax=Setaria TaxID=4554 RepID=A0A368SMA4_SETIT|nr:acyl transferase 1 [Setaria italica]XP_034571977.1 acyl transferase 1-like [Setaria viridis]RCV43493.1 hypothetical protein SETIT_9G298600v2 [Setaria italica]